MPATDARTPDDGDGGTSRLSDQERAQLEYLIRLGAYEEADALRSIIGSRRLPARGEGTRGARVQCLWRPSEAILTAGSRLSQLGFMRAR